MRYAESMSVVPLHRLVPDNKRRDEMINSDIVSRIGHVRLSNIAKAMKGKNVIDYKITTRHPGGSVIGNAVCVALKGTGIVPDEILDNLKDGDCLVVKSLSDNHVVLDEIACYYMNSNKSISGLLTDGTIPFDLINGFSKNVGVAHSSESSDAVFVDMIQIGNASICNGDVIVGNEDGVVVIPGETIAEVLNKAEEYEKNDELKLESIRNRN